MNRDMAGAGAPWRMLRPPAEPCACGSSCARRIAAVVTDVSPLLPRRCSARPAHLGLLGTNAEWTPSQTQLVSLHADQVPAKSDMSRDLAARNGFLRYPSVRQALTLDGKSLAVDGVVFVGRTWRLSHSTMWDRRSIRATSCSRKLWTFTSRPAGPSPPFSTSTSHTHGRRRRRSTGAQRRSGFPFMAGSSIPLTIRNPRWIPPLETHITEAVALGLRRPGCVRIPHAGRPAMHGGATEGRRDGSRIRRVDRGRSDRGVANGPQGAWSKPLFKPLLDEPGG